MKNFSEPTKEFEALAKAQRLEHDGNSLLGWCVSNVMIETDSSGNYRPSKKKSNEKIDLAVAAIMALAMHTVGGRAEGPSVYETRDILFI
jgi:phage terminase large subunit-like protein